MRETDPGEKLTARAGPIPVTQKTRVKLDDLARRAKLAFTPFLRLCLLAGMQTMEKLILEKEQNHE